MEFQEIKGEKVPSLGLGTYRLSGADCERSVEEGLKMGYRHVDTAQMYANEEQVGNGVRASGVDRGDVFITTKVWPSDFSRERVFETVRQSLKKLQMDHVDLLLMHWPSRDVPLSETLGAMSELRSSGSVRHVGVSNFPPEMVAEVSSHAEVFCNQIKYHPGEDRGDLLSQAGEMDYLLTAYSPISRGAVLRNPTLSQIAEEHGKTPAQVALRWLIQQEKVAAIPKATSREHLEANLYIFDFKLSKEEMQRVFNL